MLEQRLHVQYGIGLGRECKTLHERRRKHQQRVKFLLVANNGVVENLVQDGEQADVVQYGFHRGRFRGKVVLAEGVVDFHIVGSSVCPNVFGGEFAEADKVCGNVTVDVRSIHRILRQELSVHEDDLIGHELPHEVMILVKFQRSEGHPLHGILGPPPLRLVLRHRFDTSPVIDIQQPQRHMRALHEIAQILPTIHAGSPSAQKLGQPVNWLVCIEETIHETQCHHVFGGILGVVHGMKHVDHFSVERCSLGQGSGFLVIEVLVGGG
mmetsp:Transcript_32496/g.68179  ORF Transcript_32496/g.68179 Transcript_32496/m.68179 type:complete len:267 (-) Transcript_32496:2158-2958(-)